MSRIVIRTGLSLVITLLLLGIAWAQNASATGVIKSYKAGEQCVLQGNKGGSPQTFTLVKNTMVLGKPAEGSKAQIWYTQDPKTKAKTATKIQVKK